jgi:glycosyltransferase involved in cell wall biosynthesis
MRVVLLSESFSKGMGYLENLLPKYFARLGTETHVVATDLPCFYRQRAGIDAYHGFHESLRAGTTEVRDGYTLHIVGHRKILGHMRMRGLRQKLKAIRPDIVQTSTPIGWIALDAAMFKGSLGYKLFTGCHYHASVFPLATESSSFWSPERLHCLALRTLPGWLISLETERCHAITEDCADVAARFFGVPRHKLALCPLGVDTELFHPSNSQREWQERAATRSRLGFNENETVCIYTGRFTADKNPLLLARAVADLRGRGEPYRGLFVGNGQQAGEIQKCDGCLLHPFVPVHELGPLYRAADIGVWPAQESLSMLDAAACGLPIIANDTMSAKERLEGNGKTYRLNDLADLQKALLGMKDVETRRLLGQFGAQKMAEQYSWESIAHQRLRDYEIALGRKSITSENQPSEERITRGRHGHLTAPEVESE